MRGRGAVAGVTAAAVALGVAELVAVPIGARSAPLIAVGGVVVDTVPEPVKAAAIALFGVHDKTALLVGTLLILAAAAAGIGVGTVRSLRYGILGTATFGALGIAAALTRPGAGPLAAIPTLAGALAAVATAAALLSPTLLAVLRGTRRPTAVEAGAPAASVPPGPGNGEARVGRIGADPADDDWTRGGRAGRRSGVDVGRRRFLGLVAAAVGVAAVAGAAGRWLSSRRAVEAARALVRLPVAARSAAAVPPGVDPPGADPYVTRNADFYRIDTALVVPQVDPATWTLRIHGRVANPVTLTFADLLARPMIETWVTLACVSNEVGGDLIGNARWLGVPVRELLAEARPLDGADQVVSRSADGWTCGTPTDVLRDDRDAVLAVAMNGEPLPIEHGFPVRMVTPGLYGYVSACKWITELELTSFADFDAYWVPRGWSARAEVKTQSRIDAPRDDASVPAGTVVVAGVAWAQHRGVAMVEVRVDDGPWQEASLSPAASTDTWRQWTWPWPATPGEHVLRVRATDATGVVQSELTAPPAPDGASGWHRIIVDVT